MKKIITIISLVLSVSFTNAQTVADFESFSLPADSFYYSATSIDFTTTNASFQYEWITSFGGYWASGFAYTNKNDTSTAGYLNQYGCAAYKGYNNSSYYAACQAGGVIKLIAPHNFVNGFYITNSTYAYKSMKSGDFVAKKFGGPSGNDPDWLKVTVKGYLAGVMKPDSAVFYLADYRFTNNSLDYALKNWQYLNCSNLGNVDSVKFFMYSSDNGSFGMNTPAFFSMDNFTTSQGVGINELNALEGVKIFPNPAHDLISIHLNSNEIISVQFKIYNAIGIEVQNQNANVGSGSNPIQMDLSNLASGLYFIEMSTNEQKKTTKFIKD